MIGTGHDVLSRGVHDQFGDELPRHAYEIGRRLEREPVVPSAGDVNGEGFADVIVGASFANEGGSNRGAAYVALGRPLRRYNGMRRSQRFTGFNERRCRYL